MIPRYWDEGHTALSAPPMNTVLDPCLPLVVVEGSPGRGIGDLPLLI